MREAIHIFLKDTRQFRYAIALVIAWVAIFVAASAAAPEPYRHVDVWRDTIGFVVPAVSAYLLPVVWWFLIALVFHADALPGDRQFWLTRPYSRASLFGAKALFVLAYVTLPLTAAQTAVFALRGFPIAPLLSGLVWSQVLVLALVVLPAAALAALTSTLVQFVVVALLAPLLFFARGTLTPWGAFEWVRSSAAAIWIGSVATLVLYVQFARRDTRLSRLIALAGLAALVAVLPALSWRTAFAIQSHVDRTPDLRLAAEPVRHPALHPPDWIRWLPLSFRVNGAPAGTEVACEALEISIDRHGSAWNSGPVGIGSPVQSFEGTVSECSGQVPEPVIRRFADDPVNLKAVLYLTVFGAGPSTRVLMDEPPTFVPSAGLCRGATVLMPGRPGGTDPERILVAGCQTAFRAPRGPILFTSAPSDLPHTGYRWRFSYSPFPAELTIQPLQAISETNFQPTEAVTVTTRQPIAHVRAVVELPNVRLKDLE